MKWVCPTTPLASQSFAVVQEAKATGFVQASRQRLSAQGSALDLVKTGPGLFFIITVTFACFVDRTSFPANAPADRNRMVKAAVVSTVFIFCLLLRRR